MNTRLYKIIMDKLYESGLSKRDFARTYDIGHAWVIEFTNPDKPFRPLRTTSISKLHKNLDIDIEVLEEYNREVLQERGN